MKIGKSRLIKKLPRNLVGTYELIYSMKYRPCDLKDLSISEVKFIRQRCEELRLGSFDELIKELKLGITYNEFGIRQRGNHDKKD